jgi:hypothetical protein
MSSDKDKSVIPEGQYCYDEFGVCPYWSLDPTHPEQENGHCAYLEQGDWETGGLLWDEVKECGINEDVSPEVEGEFEEVTDFFQKRKNGKWSSNDEENDD